MAGRKDKNTVDYFPHYCNAGKTLFILENKFGIKGYGVWFKTLELLGSSENHYIDLREETDLLFLVSKLNISEEELNEMYNLLAKLDAIDSYLWSKKIVFSQNFINNIQDAYKRRTNKCMNKSDLCIHLFNKCEQKEEKEIHKSSKESKVNKSKVNKSTATDMFNENSLKYLISKKIKLKDINTEIINSLINEKEKIYLKTAIGFYKLFENHLKESKVPMNTLHKSNVNWANTIRLMYTNDGYTLEDFKIVYEFLGKSWWKGKVLSVPKLREKMQTLLSQAREKPKEKGPVLVPPSKEDLEMLNFQKQMDERIGNY